MMNENSTMDQLHTIVEPVYIPWRDPRPADDTSTRRKLSGNNYYDPSSLLTGAMEAEGLTYTNSVVLVPRHVAPEDLAPCHVKRVPKTTITLWPSVSDGFYGAEMELPNGTLITKRGEGLALARRLLYYLGRYLVRAACRRAGKPSNIDEMKADREAALARLHEASESTPGPRGNGPLL